MKYRALALALLITPSALAQDTGPLHQLPYSPSLDLTSMDREVNACEDFYRFSCGNWIRKNPIPSDQASWDVYGKLTYDNERFLWGLLEEASHDRPGRTAAEQKTGDYFQACMAEDAIDRAGIKPIEPLLKAIAAITTPDGVVRFATAQHRDRGDGSLLFSFSSNQDFEDSQSVIAFANRGRLGLPDRDYYTKSDPKSVEIRTRYVDHMAKVFAMLGDDAKVARQHAEQAMAIETALAGSMLTRVELRDPHKLLHKLDRAQLQSLSPSLDWPALFRATGQSNVQIVNVTEPAYFGELEKQLHSADIGAWHSYLRWNVVRESSNYLSKPYVDTHFEFFGKYLRGIPEIQPRWRRCVRWVDRDLGEALGQVFVARTFTPETKERTVAMTKAVEDAMEEDLKSLPWMGEATRKQALQKLHTIVNKVGYPDKWRDYGALEIRRGDFAGNVERAALFEYRRQLAKIGKPLDRTEWGMTPPTVNAGYDPQMNDINFPAGVLQPPLYDPRLDDAPNYGNTGATIGHELTHGFDDEGRQFDAKGNLKDWWTPDDGAEFEHRANSVSDQYSGYTIVDDIKINGKLTLGEDVADLGGTLLAYNAWRRATQAAGLHPIGGFTPEQRFFIGMAQWACGDVRPEMKRERAITDPHSPLEYRVNGVVSNMPEFAAAFGCKVGQKMVRANPCRVW
jgi:endothelin-converting enzyme/putative endopeptidase